MLTLKNAFTSSVGKKFIMGLSGLLLTGFLIEHLIGNLALYSSDGTAYNSFVLFLHDFGKFLYVAEIALAGIFLIHIFAAINVTSGNRIAKTRSPYMSKPKKGSKDSKNTSSSRKMIYTGVGLLIFLIIHIWSFRFGPGIEEGYTTMIDGRQARDLHRLVYETFQDPLWAGGYALVMFFLGFHLRHGFWSAFQSLGLAFPRFSKIIYALGVLLALLVAAGFLFIPIAIYFDIPSQLGI